MAGDDTQGEWTRAAKSFRDAARFLADPVPGSFGSFAAVEKALADLSPWLPLLDLSPFNSLPEVLPGRRSESAGRGMPQAYPAQGTAGRPAPGVARTTRQPDSSSPSRHLAQEPDISWPGPAGPAVRDAGDAAFGPGSGVRAPGLDEVPGDRRSAPAFSFRQRGRSGGRREGLLPGADSRPARQGGYVVETAAPVGKALRSTESSPGAPAAHRHEEDRPKDRGSPWRAPGAGEPVRGTALGPGDSGSSERSDRREFPFVPETDWKSWPTSAWPSPPEFPTSPTGEQRGWSERVSDSADSPMAGQAWLEGHSGPGMEAELWLGERPQASGAPASMDTGGEVWDVAGGWSQPMALLDALAEAVLRRGSGGRLSRGPSAGHPVGMRRVPEGEGSPSRRAREAGTSGASPAAEAMRSWPATGSYGDRTAPAGASGLDATWEGAAGGSVPAAALRASARGAGISPAPFVGTLGATESAAAMDANSLASLVNDALVEQARRHGVDLS